MATPAVLRAAKSEVQSMQLRTPTDCNSSTEVEADIENRGQRHSRPGIFSLERCEYGEQSGSGRQYREHDAIGSELIAEPAHQSLERIKAVRNRLLYNDDQDEDADRRCLTLIVARYAPDPCDIPSESRPGGEGASLRKSAERLKRS